MSITMTAPASTGTCTVCADPLPPRQPGRKPRVVCGTDCANELRSRQLHEVKARRRKIPNKPKGHPNFTWDGWTDRGWRQAARDIVDDFGVVTRRRRCRSCRAWKPEDYDHFSTHGTDGPRVTKWETECRPCKKEANQRMDAARTLEQKREIWRRRWDKIKADPERRAIQRAYEETYRNRDPERYRRLEREAKRRYWQGLRADPERWEAYKQTRQAWVERRRKERALARREDDKLAATPLPSRPLALALDKLAVRRGIDENTITVMIDASQRLLYAWRRSERATVEYGRIDEILTATDLMWWEVYDEESLRLTVLPVTEYRWVKRKDKSGGRRRHLEVSGRFGYGDVGPDLETLEMVRRTFEGDDVASELVAA